jgi:hypothetical protein
MANNFTSYVNKDVGTSAATIVTGSGQTTVIGMTIANTSTSPITVDVYVTRSATNYYIIKGATVPVGGALVPIGGDQKLVLVAGDVLKAVSSAAASADVITSMLVIS